MTDNRRSDPGAKTPRSRAPEFTPAKTKSTAQPAEAESGGAKTDTPAAAQPAAQPDKPPTGDRPAPPSGAQLSAPGNGQPARGMATEVPVKIAPQKPVSQYVVSINNKTGLVTAIERFDEASGERKALSQPEHARVAAQLGTAARPLAAAMSARASAAPPPMLNAPAFNALAARAAAMPPTLSQLAPGAGASAMMGMSGAPPVAPLTSQGGITAADATALMQAYFQGVLDYLNAAAIR